MSKRKTQPEPVVAVSERFHLTLPEDFHSIYSLAARIAPQTPLQAFQFLGLQLVGPFELLADAQSPTDAQTWRFWADPPEVTTFAISMPDSGTATTGGHHFGFFRDLPEEEPLGVVQGERSSNAFKYVACSLTGLLHSRLKAVTAADSPGLTAVREYLGKAPKHLLEKTSAAWKSREKKLVATTSNGLGVCVPFDKKRQTGYRELPVSKKALWGIFQAVKNKQEVEKNRKKLEEVFNWVNIGNDEMDFGQGFELGMELFAADRVHDEIPLAFAKAAGIFLKNAYKLLGREAWIPVLDAALDARKNRSTAELRK